MFWTLYTRERNLKPCKIIFEKLVIDQMEEINVKIKLKGPWWHTKWRLVSLLHFRDRQYGPDTNNVNIFCINLGIMQDGQMKEYINNSWKCQGGFIETWIFKFRNMQSLLSFMERIKTSLINFRKFVKYDAL